MSIISGNAAANSPTFPASLPDCFLQRGFSYTPTKSTKTSPVDAGLSLSRRIKTVSAWNLSGSFIVSKAQKDTLDAFVKDEIDNGAKTFWKVDPIDNVTNRLWRLLAPVSCMPIDGSGYIVAMRLVRVPV